MMNNMIMHPGILLILCGVIIPLLGDNLKKFITFIVPAICFIIILQLPHGMYLNYEYMSYNLIFLRVDELSKIFALVFIIMIIFSSIFSLNQKNKIEISTAFIYGGSAISAVLSGDFISLFIFWEIMAISSTLIIWMGSKNAYKSGLRYLTVHLFGGVILLIGIIGYMSLKESADFTLIDKTNIYAYFILIGVLINAGAPPFSGWISDSYPSASWSGTVFLSAFTTKTAVYFLIRGYPGTELLIYIGIFMIFYGIVYAILENDMRRILSYSIINQVGFMITGIGIGTEIALNGAASHAFAHIIYKALLLMSAGSVFYITGKTKCTDLGGLYKTMPITMVCGIIGALSISAFPFTSGFITKSMISQSAVYENYTIIWFLLLAASAGVFLHAGIKFPWFVFFQKDAKLKAKDPPKSMQFAMISLSIICILIGIFPNVLYQMLPYDVNYIPYTFDHVFFQLQLLLFSGLAFFLMLKYLKRTLTLTLEFDWFWRKFSKILIKDFDIHAEKTATNVINKYIKIFDKAIKTLYKHHGPSGILGRTWPTGNMAFWTTVILASYLIIYLL